MRKKKNPKKRKTDVSDNSSKLVSTSMENLSESNRLQDDRKRKICDVSSASEDTFLNSPERLRETIIDIVNETIHVELEKASNRITESLKAIFTDKLEKLEGQLFSLQTQHDTHATEINALKHKYSDYQYQLNDKDLVIQNLDQTVASLSKQVNTLKLQINDNAQYTRKNTVRIFGIPEAPNEDTMKVVSNFFQSTMRLRGIDVEVAHRTGKKIIPVRTPPASPIARTNANVNSSGDAPVNSSGDVSVINSGDAPVISSGDVPVINSDDAPMRNADETHVINSGEARVMNSTYASVVTMRNPKRPIICKLLRRTDKIRVMKTRYILKKIPGIDVKEELTSYNLYLLREASKHELVKSAWAFNGKIFVKGETGAPKTISSLDDITVPVMFPCNNKIA